MRCTAIKYKLDHFGNNWYIVCTLLLAILLPDAYHHYTVHGQKVYISTTDCAGKPSGKYN